MADSVNARVPFLAKCCVGLGVGTVGGYLFTLLTAPIPWMLGALCFTIILALARVPFTAPKLFRTASLMVVGLLLGSAFSPEILDQMGKWLGAVGLNVLYLMSVIVLGTLYFQRFAGHDVATAYFAAAPGGLVEMPFFAEAYGGKAKDVSLAHSIRVALVVLTIPVYVRVTEADTFLTQQAATAAKLSTPFDLKDAAILIATALAGYVVARRLRLPAAPLVGTMIASIIVHLTGLTGARPPVLVFSAAQVVLGVALGTYFIGVRFREVARISVVSAGWTVVLVFIATVFAIVGSRLLDFPFHVLLIALAPGGQAEMGLVALALGIEVALVATMHFVRASSMFLLAPLVFRLVAGPPEKEHAD